MWFVVCGFFGGLGLCVAGGMSAPSQCDAHASATPRDDQPKPVRRQKNAGQDHFQGLIGHTPQILTNGTRQALPKADRLYQKQAVAERCSIREIRDA